MVKKLWLYKPPKPSAAKVSDFTKATITAKAETLINEFFKPNYIEQPDPGSDNNCLVDVFGNWHGRYFYFCSKYNCPSENALSPSFELKFARIECVGNDRFNLSYMRHTGQWHQISDELTMDEFFEELSSNPIFSP